MAKNGGTTGFAQVMLWLAVIGAVNWGLVGVFNFDLVRAIFGNSSTTDASGFSRIVYALVGLAGLGLAAVSPRLRAAARDDRAVSHPIGGRTVDVRP